MMGQNMQIVIRSHAQEREWLLRLGDGNIVAGVQKLIGQAKKKREITPKKNKKSKR
jgi:hypothetical protein